MRIMLILLLYSFTCSSQSKSNLVYTTDFSTMGAELGFVREKDERPSLGNWKLTGNHLLTGGMVLISGAARGFNETLHFHWKAFRHSFPNANPEWFNPAISWKNKYKRGDPDAGARFPLSTSLLVMTTDQYHLNNFIMKAGLTGALVIKIGEGKKPFRYYLYDFLYYSACYQLGFSITYYPFKGYRGN